ncbi:MAG: hypothetical protein WDN44_08860 [Sphingomonas sp.]
MRSPSWRIEMSSEPSESGARRMLVSRTPPESRIASIRSSIAPIHSWRRRSSGACCVSAAAATSGGRAGLAGRGRNDRDRGVARRGAPRRGRFGRGGERLGGKLGLEPQVRGGKQLGHGRVKLESARTRALA